MQLSIWLSDVVLDVILLDNCALLKEKMQTLAGTTYDELFGNDAVDNASVAVISGNSSNNSTLENKPENQLDEEIFGKKLNPNVGY